MFNVSISGLSGRTMDSAPLHTPFSNLAFSIGAVRFTGDTVVLAAVALAIVASLTIFFRRSNTGIAIRAAAENSDRARLMGMPVRRLSTLVWVIAAVLYSRSGATASWRFQRRARQL